MQLRDITKQKDLSNKRVLLRVDYNVGIDKKGRVHAHDLFRIERTLPTIKWLIQKRAKIIIISHRGRPQGENERYSLKPVAVALGKLLAKPVKCVPAYTAAAAQGYVEKIKPGQVIMLENLRFHPGEANNDLTHAHDIARLGDVFVQDGFGVIHRESASVVGIPEYLPSYAGLLVQEEVRTLSQFIKKPPQPCTLMMGGAKVATKLPLVHDLLPKVHTVLTGGVVANTILKSGRYATGASIVDTDFIAQAKELTRNKKVMLPTDVICDNERTTKIESTQKSIEEIQTHDVIVDIGTQTAVAYAKILRESRSVLWNGPLGWIEKRQGAHASEALAELIATLSHQKKLHSVIGGGETISLCARLGVLEHMTFVSTGGGAMLSFLHDPKQPGLLPLQK